MVNVSHCERLAKICLLVLVKGESLIIGIIAGYRESGIVVHNGSVVRVHLDGADELESHVNETILIEVHAAAIDDPITITVV